MSIYCVPVEVLKQPQCINYRTTKCNRCFNNQFVPFKDKEKDYYEVKSEE